MRTLLILIVVVLLAGGAVAGGGWLEYQRFLEAPVSAGSDEPVVIRIPPGQSLRGLAERLAADGHVRNALWFVAHAYRSGQHGAIKAGEYAVPADATPSELLGIVTRGRSIQYAVTLVEGRTFREALAALAAAEALEVELAERSDAEIMARVGIDAPDPEGWIFPDTYLYTRGSSDTEILRRAHRRMQRVLSEEWAGRSEGLPLEQPYQALILASIVEKETGIAGERAAIAGVFTRRLRRGMRLQTDPTVIYGLGDDYDGDLTRAHLEAPTPYNTYVVDGLPPTPIALPGRAAIHAVLHPDAGDALYFVARGDGSHHFSATLDEHNCAVRHYQLGRTCAALEEQP